MLFPFLKSLFKNFKSSKQSQNSKLGEIILDKKIPKPIPEKWKSMDDITIYRTFNFVNFDKIFDRGRRVDVDLPIDNIDDFLKYFKIYDKSRFTYTKFEKDILGFEENFIQPYLSDILKIINMPQTSQPTAALFCQFHRFQFQIVLICKYKIFFNI